MRQFEPYGFAHTAAQPVSDDRLAQSPRRGESEMGSGDRDIREAKRREERTRIARALVVDLSEIARPQEPYTFGKRRSFQNGMGQNGTGQNRNVRDPATSLS
jgi:hypothetical protein